VEPGEDYIDTIRTTIPNCKIFFALIGEQWLAALARRSDRASPRHFNDPVILEISTALAADVFIIPVLIDNADMPESRDTPAEVKLSSASCHSTDGVRVTGQGRSSVTVSPGRMTQAWVYLTLPTAEPVRWKT
jgi:hypothetical protein